MEEIDTLIKYIWLAIVTFVGGVLGFVKKILPQLKGAMIYTKLRSLLISVVTSMFVAYIVYELVYWFIQSERLAIAFAGLASFAGTDLLVTLQQLLVDVIKKKVNKL